MIGKTRESGKSKIWSTKSEIAWFWICLVIFAVYFLVALLCRNCRSSQWEGSDLGESENLNYQKNRNYWRKLLEKPEIWSSISEFAWFWICLVSFAVYFFVNSKKYSFITSENGKVMKCWQLYCKMTTKCKHIFTKVSAGGPKDPSSSLL